MKRREQADLLLHKAAQDEALLDEVLGAASVSDEIIGFHCQQAAEKMLKAVLSDLGLQFKRTHDLGALMELLRGHGRPLPEELADLDTLTPYGAIYRYEYVDAGAPLDRPLVRRKLAGLRAWAEERLRSRTPDALAS